MTSRKSSGSSRAESSVERTRSQNITVSCRRSASAPPLPSPPSGGGGAGGGAIECSDGVKQASTMPDQTDAKILQVLGGQARQYPCVDPVCAERRLGFVEA